MGTPGYAGAGYGFGIVGLGIVGSGIGGYIRLASGTAFGFGPGTGCRISPGGAAGPFSGRGAIPPSGSGWRSVVAFGSGLLPSADAAGLKGLTCPSGGRATTRRPAGSGLRSVPARAVATQRPSR